MKPKNLLLERVLAKLILENFKLTQLEIYEDKYENDIVHRFFYYADGLPPPEKFPEKYSLDKNTYVSIHIFPSKDSAQNALDELKMESYVRTVPTII